MFADHDLVGIPHRLVVSERNIEQNCVEYKSRATGEIQQFSLDTAVDSILKLIAKTDVLLIANIFVRRLVNSM